MVMEMPSPQCVGQEFVRQYYTLLHQAPEHMHRYSYLPSFVTQFNCMMHSLSTILKQCVTLVFNDEQCLEDKREQNSALCYIVYHNCTQLYAHEYEQFLQVK